MFQTPEGGAPPLGQGAADFLGNIPVVSGLLNLGTRQIQQGPAATYLLGANPDYNRIQSLPAGPEKTQALQDFRMSQLQNAVLGGVGGLENVGAKAARGAVGAVGADQSAIAAKLAAAEKAPLTKSPAQAALDEAAAPTRFTVEVGAHPEAPAFVVDTKTGDKLPQFFLGPQKAEQAGAETARRNAAIAQSDGAKAAAEAVAPKGNPLRDLTNEQLGALYQVTTNPADRNVIGALLGERAFAIAPEVKIAKAVEYFDRNVGTQIRRSLRGIETDLSGVDGAIDKAIKDAGVTPSPANRAAVLQGVMDAQAHANVRNLAVNAKRVKPTGVPAVDAANVQLVHAEGDLKAGVHPAQVYEDATAAIKNSLDQLELPVGPPGDGGLPPMGPPTTTRAPQPPGGAGRKVGRLFQAGLDLMQGTRNIASGDISQVGSQTFPMLFKSPKSFVKGNLEGFKALAMDDSRFAAQQQKWEVMVNQEGVGVGNQPGQLFLRKVGTNIETGEERFAGIQRVRDLVNDVGQKVPALKAVFAPVRLGLGYLKRTEKEFVGGINAVATYGFLSAVRGQEWLYRRPLALAEKQSIADNINILLGRGFHFPKQGVDADGLVTLAKVANSLGFSPQNTVARARIVPEAAYRAARALNDIRKLKAPRPEDVDYLQGAGAFLASTLGVTALAAKALNVNPVLDSGSTNFMKIDLGPDSPELGKLVAAMEFVGMRSQTYNGHVYLDFGQGAFQDLRVLTALVGPVFGHLPTDSKGHAWNPYSPKGTESSALDILVRFAENRLHPGASTVAGVLEGRPIDYGDPTQNPITSLMIPLFIQGGLSASGLSKPGGPLRIPGVAGPSAADAEKQRLNTEAPSIPNLDTLSTDRQKQYMDQVSAAKQTALGALTASPEYQALPDAEKRAEYQKLSDSTSKAASKAFGLDVAVNGTPEEAKTGALIAFSSTPKSYDRGALLRVLQTGGKLTPEIKSAIDSQRKQTDQSKPNYDLSADDYLHGAQLVDTWLRTPQFVFGTEAEWKSAARAAELLRKMVAEDDRKGVKPSEDSHITEFYFASPSLATFYEKDGSRRNKFVSPQRQAIEKDLLWDRFSASARDKEAAK